MEKLNVINIDEFIKFLKKNSRIGLFFGSFDPFHHGHLEVAEVMLQFCDAIFITTVKKNRKKPWLSNYQHRIKMIENALKEISKPIYFVKNNLNEIIHYLKGSYSLCGIMGSDVYNYFIENKMNPKMKVDEFFVIPRNDIKPITNYLIDKKITFLDSNLFKQQIYSSTQIRKSIKENQFNNLPISHSNIAYIKKNHLYGN